MVDNDIVPSQIADLKIGLINTTGERGEIARYSSAADSDNVVILTHALSDFIRKKIAGLTKFRKPLIISAWEKRRQYCRELHAARTP